MLRLGILVKGSSLVSLRKVVGNSEAGFIPAIAAMVVVTVLRFLFEEKSVLLVSFCVGCLVWVLPTMILTCFLGEMIPTALVSFLKDTLTSRCDDVDVCEKLRVTSS